MSWTEDERVAKGSLFVVTYKGGSVGSKGDHEVCKPSTYLGTVGTVPVAYYILILPF